MVARSGMDGSGSAAAQLLAEAVRRVARNTAIDKGLGLMGGAATATALALTFFHTSAQTIITLGVGAILAALLLPVVGRLLPSQASVELRREAARLLDEALGGHDRFLTLATTPGGDDPMLRLVALQAAARVQPGTTACATPLRLSRRTRSSCGVACAAALIALAALGARRLWWPLQAVAVPLHGATEIARERLERAARELARDGQSSAAKWTAARLETLRAELERAADESQVTVAMKAAREDLARHGFDVPSLLPLEIAGGRGKGSGNATGDGAGAGRGTGTGSGRGAGGQGTADGKGAGDAKGLRDHTGRSGDERQAGGQAGGGDESAADSRAEAGSASQPRNETGTNGGAGGLSERERRLAAAALEAAAQLAREKTAAAGQQVATAGKRTDVIDARDGPHPDSRSPERAGSPDRGRSPERDGGGIQGPTSSRDRSERPTDRAGGGSGEGSIRPDADTGGGAGGRTARERPDQSTRPAPSDDTDEGIAATDQRISQRGRARQPSAPADQQTGTPEQHGSQTRDDGDASGRPDPGRGGPPRRHGGGRGEPGLGRDARFVVVHIPAPPNDEGPGDGDRAPGPGRLRIDTPYSNAPLAPQRGPAAAVERQPVPFEYRGVLGAEEKQ